MPTVVAKRQSKCVACGQAIQEGEFILYLAKDGARHLACSDQPTGKRLNEHTAHCAYCDRLLYPGHGSLTLLEDPDDPRIHKWIVQCLDGC